MHFFHPSRTMVKTTVTARLTVRAGAETVLDLVSSFVAEDDPYGLAAHAIDGVCEDARDWTFESKSKPYMNPGIGEVTIKVSVSDAKAGVLSAETFTVTADTNSNLVTALRQAVYSAKDSARSWTARSKRTASQRTASQPS